jgi:hypothetical protein
MQILKAGALYFALVFGAGFALGLLLAAEFAVILALRGATITEYVASRDTVAGTVYLVLLGVFAVMPLLVARRR